MPEFTDVIVLHTKNINYETKCVYEGKFYNVLLNVSLCVGLAVWKGNLKSILWGNHLENFSDALNLPQRWNISFHDFEQCFNVSLGFVAGKNLFSIPLTIVLLFYVWKLRFVNIFIGKLRFRHFYVSINTANWTFFQLADERLFINFSLKARILFHQLSVRLQVPNMHLNFREAKVENIKFQKFNSFNLFKCINMSSM